MARCQTEDFVSNPVTVLVVVAMAIIPGRAILKVRMEVVATKTRIARVDDARVGGIQSVKPNLVVAPGAMKTLTAETEIADGRGHATDYSLLVIAQ